MKRQRQERSSNDSKFLSFSAFGERFDDIVSPALIRWSNDPRTQLALHGIEENFSDLLELLCVFLYLKYRNAHFTELYERMKCPTQVDILWHVLMLHPQINSEFWDGEVLLPPESVPHYLYPATYTQLSNGVDCLISEYRKHIGSAVSPLWRELLKKECPFEAEEVQIFVNMPSGRIVTPTMNTAMTVKEFNKFMAENYYKDYEGDINDLINQFRVVHKGKQLENERALFEYEVKDMDTIHQLFRMCGC